MGLGVTPCVTWKWNVTGSGANDKLIKGDELRGHRRKPHSLIEALCDTIELQTLLTGDFGNGGSRCQVTLEDSDVTCGFDRVRQGPDDILSGEVELGDISEVLSNGLPSDRQLRAINDIGVVEEVLRQGRDASNLVQVLHHILSGRSRIRVFSRTIVGFWR